MSSPRSWPKRTGVTPAGNGTGSPSSTATPTRSSASRPKLRNGARRSPSSSTSSTSSSTCGKPLSCFTPPGDTRATEDQVTAWGLDILAGNSRGVIAGIQARAAADPPRPGSEHEKNIRQRRRATWPAKEPYLGYPAALARGWPIATGIIEGACRHLVGDRMGITGARWSLAGAQSVLWMRAIARQRRPRRLLGPPHPARTPAQPPQQIPESARAPATTSSSPHEGPPGNSS